MKLRRIYTKYFPLKGYIACTVYPWVFIRKDRKKSFTPTICRHEVIHGIQQIETAFVFFFLLYAIEYVVKLLLCKLNHNRAYKSISFEQEARLNCGNTDYRNNRSHYAWVKYVFKLWKLN